MSPVMLHFKKIKMEYYGRAQKTFSVPPGMLEGVEKSIGEKKQPFRRSRSNVFDRNPSDRQKLVAEGSKIPIFGFHF